MPTDVISKIGATNTPTTMDYSTLQAWEDACPANLVTDDKRWIGECYDQGQFSGATPLLIAGQTVDSTRYVILRCATGASFKDKAGVRSTALAYNSSNGVSVRQTGNPGFTNVRTDTNYTRIDGLQLQDTTGYGSGALYINAASNCVFTNCIVDGNAVIVGDNQTNVYRNILLVSSRAGGLINRGSYYNCTVIQTAGTGTGFTNQYGNGTFLQNCAFFGMGTLESQAPVTGSDYNATNLSDSWGTGTHNLNSLTFASQFVSSTTDWRAVSTGGLRAGTPDVSTPTDISGFARNATTPYIGAWEVATASPSSSPSSSPSTSSSQSSSASSSQSASHSSSQSASQSSSASPSQSPSASPSGSTSPSGSQSSSQSASQSSSQSASSSGSASPSGNPSPSSSPSSSPSGSASSSSSQSASHSSSLSSSRSESSSGSSSPSSGGEDADVEMIAAAPLEIRPGDLITQDPAESRVYRFNFDRENLPDGVSIDDYTITTELQKPPFYGSVPIDFDWDSDDKVLSDRAVDARFFSGTLGAIYRCCCEITTNENPAQTKKRSFFVLIQRG